MRRLSIPLLLAVSGLGCGSAPPPTPPQLNGCEEYADRSAATADRQVGFGTALGSGAVAYEPRCMAIAAGQSVTFVGNFSTHPLSPGAPQTPDAGSPSSPIARQETGSADYTVSFPTAGVYPYYCELHEPTMAGVVWVK